MTADLARMLAALRAAAREPDGAADTTEALAALREAAAAPRPNGRPPALTPEQVRSIRRRRRLPLARRPHVAELAAEFRVNEVTIRKALRAAPPYDFGEPVPRKGGKHRTGRPPA